MCNNMTQVNEFIINIEMYILIVETRNLFFEIASGTPTGSHVGWLDEHVPCNYNSDNDITRAYLAGKQEATHGFSNLGC